MKKQAEFPGKKVIPLLSLAAITLFFSILHSFSKAQDLTGEQALEVSPPTQDAKADPGTTIDLKATVTNKSQVTLPIEARIENFVATGDEGQVALTEDSPWAVSSWTTLTPKTFMLEPGKSQEVTAIVDVPRDAAGGRYGSFVFSVVGPDGKSSSTTVTQEVASLFLLRISGEITENLKIASMTAPAFSEFGPVTLTLAYENTGNVHLRPMGSITIRDTFGRIVSYVHANATNIFPGATRKVPVSWEKKLLIGRFTAEAAIRTGGTNRTPITATATFIVFPIRLAALIVVAAVLVFMLRKRIRKAVSALLD